MEQARSPAQVDWHSDAYWQTRRLSPAQLQIHDVRIEGWRNDIGPMLEMKEVLSSTLLPALEKRNRLSDTLRVEEFTKNRSEQHHLRALANEFGWMNCLRSDLVQKTVSDSRDTRLCRWIHISSKFSDYLAGCLLALSDWGKDPQDVLTALHQLEHCIHQNERFSKHGRYFAPFVQDLTDPDEYDEGHSGDRPMLLSIPFLDWTVDDETPPLRFQVDPRENYQSSRSTSHKLRSILQHFYRLEDTSDREAHQVFTKHKPWQTDRALDLKVRRWYGHYPTGLNVDELWILVIDDRHIVTFSSNQSWKSRWPPLQLSARILEVSFRNVRNAFLNTTELDYTSSTHIVTALSGAMGMLHRSFWTDITLCLSDRYASYLGHLQYRLHRSPSTKLVMDLLQVQEELNIIIQIMDQQLDVVTKLQDMSGPPLNRHSSISGPQGHRLRDANTITPSGIATYRQLSFSRLSDPSAQLLENLKREYSDLCDLRENSNALINRTIQLVNIRLEDHGKAILVFTIVTIIFLPLSFVSSFFGMNFSDIRDMETTQRLFWIISSSLTLGVLAFSLFLAFYGSAIKDWLVSWNDNRTRRSKNELASRGIAPGLTTTHRSFEILDNARSKPIGTIWSRSRKS